MALSDLKEEFVDEIIICDSSDLEDQIKGIDQSGKLTNIRGSVVQGKTIFQNDTSTILLVTEIAVAIGENSTLINNNIKFDESSTWAFKTLFHEFGHAKNNFEHGKLVTKPITDSYHEFLNEHWKILRDEYLAEMFCSNINKFTSSIKWYGDFSDAVEEENFRSYAKEYSQSEEGLSWHLAFQILHQYYFIPLFHMDRNNMRVWKTYLFVRQCQKILSFNVPENNNVPNEYNSLFLEKWEEFQILGMLKK